MNGRRQDALEQQALERVQELIAALESLPDPAVAAPARELVQLVLDLHGNGLARLLQIIAGAANSQPLLERLAIDDQVKGLLLLHGLHPEGLETRVGRALDLLRPHLAVMGVGVKTVTIESGVVQLELHCGADGERRPLAAQTLRREIEDAIFDLAPDVAGIEMAGLPVPAAAAARPSVWSWRPDRLGAADHGA